MNGMPTASALTLIVAAGSVFGEVSSGTLQSISIPDTVETSIGTLNFLDGVPTEDTIDKHERPVRRSRSTAGHQS